MQIELKNYRHQISHKKVESIYNLSIGILNIVNKVENKFNKYFRRYEQL